MDEYFVTCVKNFVKFNSYLINRSTDVTLVRKTTIRGNNRIMADLEQKGIVEIMVKIIAPPPYKTDYKGKYHKIEWKFTEDTITVLKFLEL